MKTITKTITIKIPTSIKEFKALCAEHSTKRKRHNITVVKTLYYDILSEMKSNYWKNDVSDYFRENFECHIREKLIDSILKIK